MSIILRLATNAAYILNKNKEQKKSENETLSMVLEHGTL